MSQVEHLLLLLVVPLAAWAAIVDARTGLIPNRLVLVALSLGLILRVVGALVFAAPSALVQTVLAGLIGMLVCAVTPGMLYALRGMGGGDLKLLCALGWCVGARAGLELQLYAFAFGALYALTRLAYAGGLWRGLVSSMQLLRRPLSSSVQRAEASHATLAEVRFGPAIFAGTALVAVMHGVVR
jgi:prepilin peptidase CpaA